MEEEIEVTVRRGIGQEDPGETATYRVPFEKGMTVLGVLEQLYRRHGVAYRHSCDIGLCAICTMKINGKPRMACRTILDDPQDVVLEPLSTHPVLRDLVVDFDKGKDRDAN